MSRAIDKVPHCTTMLEVRQGVDALDDLLVPLLVARSGFMTQAARVKNDAQLVRDEARIQAVVDRVRERAVAEGGDPALLEQMYRGMMELFIAYEHQELARQRAAGLAPETDQE
ncbi:MAG: chorismate mutase [Comamonas sp.]